MAAVPGALRLRRQASPERREDPSASPWLGAGVNTDGAETMRKELPWLATEVGAVLMLVPDDDERERLQEHFERELNRELHAAFGGPPRVRPLLELVRPAPAPVIDLAGRREAAGV